MIDRLRTVAAAGLVTPLHARARLMGPVAAGVAVLTVLAVSVLRWSPGIPVTDAGQVRLSVLVLAPLALAMALSATLSGADVDLERSTPKLTGRRRVAHAAAAVTVASAALGVAVAVGPADDLAAAVLRNAVGLFGLVLLTATVLPTAATWAPALGYAAFLLLATPRPAPPGSHAWAWLVQPAAAAPSWVVAVGLLLVGTALYGYRGAAR